MLYGEPTDLGKKRLEAVKFTLATMDRQSVRAGMRFAKEVAREYARNLAQSGEVDTTFSTMRMLALVYGSEWLQTNTAPDFSSRFEELVDGAISPILGNPSFRNADEMDQIAGYGSQASMAIILEDAGFGNGSPVEPDFLTLLQRPWASTFGSSVFLIR
jgi:hypothetical protein